MNRLFDCYGRKFPHSLDRFRRNTRSPSLPRKKMLRNFVAFFFLNGNRISQQRFMPKDLAHYDRRDHWTWPLTKPFVGLSGNESEGRAMRKGARLVGYARVSKADDC